MSALRLRQAVPADAAAISQLEQQIFGDDAWSAQQVAEELSGDFRSYWVLVDVAEQICGYAGVLALGGEADVQTIALHPAARGAGWGKVLLQQIAQSAAEVGATQLFLEVRADNPAAIGLYQRLGFTQLGVRPGYYQPAGVDALLMRALLPLVTPDTLPAPAATVEVASSTMPQSQQPGTANTREVRSA